jgi:hypothetical protein
MCHVVVWPVLMERAAADRVVSHESFCYDFLVSVFQYIDNVLTVSYGHVYSTAIVNSVIVVVYISTLTWQALVTMRTNCKFN